MLSLKFLNSNLFNVIIYYHHKGQDMLKRKIVQNFVKQRRLNGVVLQDTALYLNTKLEATILAIGLDAKLPNRQKFNEHTVDWITPLREKRLLHSWVHTKQHLNLSYVLLDI